VPDRGRDDKSLLEIPKAAPPDVMNPQPGTAPQGKRDYQFSLNLLKVRVAPGRVRRPKSGIMVGIRARLTKKCGDHARHAW
jgi:hypothetical protein